MLNFSIFLYRESKDAISAVLISDCLWKSSKSSFFPGCQQGHLFFRWLSKKVINVSSPSSFFKSPRLMFSDLCFIILWEWQSYCRPLFVLPKICHLSQGQQLLPVKFISLCPQTRWVNSCCYIRIFFTPFQLSSDRCTPQRLCNAVLELQIALLSLVNTNKSL